MTSKITLAFVLLFSVFAHAQVEFEEQVVIDDSRYVQSPNSVFTGDFDGDGDLDVLTASYFGGQVVWYENLDGAGTDVQRHTIATGLSTPWGVTAADMDGDGDLDAMVTAYSGGSVILYENTDGAGTFVYKGSGSAYQANRLEAVDMDNDGDLDVVWSSSGDGKIRWIPNTNGLGTFGSTFTIENNATSIRDLHAVDIDGDGDMDVVSAFAVNSAQGLSWYRNTNGTFSNRINISSAFGYIYSMDTADFDGDGDMDVVASSTNDNKIAWFENVDGLGAFGPEQVISTASEVGKVRTADMDGDGDMDILYSKTDDFTLGWFENLDGAGGFSSELVIDAVDGTSRELHIVDMDADGDLDFIANIGNNIILYHNNGNTGSFEPSILTKHIDGGRIVYADDIDGDGDKDIVAASYWDDKISWYENLDGQGNFYNTQKIIASTLNGATSVHVGDVDGDGFNDVLATSYLDYEVVWYKNLDGLGTFGEANIIDDNLYNAGRVYLSDIDADGDMDVFALGSTRVAWYENLDGQGTFGTVQTIELISNFRMHDIAFADLDGDGDLDLSVAGTYGLMQFYNLDGQGTFGPRQLLETSNTKGVSTEAADIDNDGDMDLVYLGYIGTSSSSNYLAWFENTDGLGTFGPMQTVSTLVATPTSVIVADFDNDGDLDIASLAQGNGGVIAWYENTDGLGNFSNTQQIISQTYVGGNDIFAADIDGNNTMDIVSISEADSISWFRNMGTPMTNSITGTVRFDLLGDGCTPTDNLLTGMLIVSEGTTSTDATFTQENGQFQIYTTDEGQVLTQLISQLPTYYTASPSSYESNFTGLGNSDTVDFCVEPIGDINDLVIGIYRTGPSPRSGFDTSYRITYKNQGTVQLDGTVSYEFDGSKLNFLNASETVASQTTNALTFDFVGLNPFEVRYIDVFMNVFAPPTTNIDDVLLTTVSIDPVAGDFAPENNTRTISQIVVGSYDPNDITCMEGDEVLIGDADKYLHYVIRFQNTGTASAINVRVEHTLDAKLDWSSMQVESMSHTGRVSIHNSSDVTFTFDNINLPDSTSDEPNSHGFIAFKIKPMDEVVVGDVVNATADIYFDFNPPIITNTASTEFVETLSVTEFEADTFTVYPNPTTGILNVVSSTAIETITMYNHLGQLVLSAKDTTSVDISGLNAGVYVLTLTDANGRRVSKKVVKR
ncbi:T9SS type A sorting domain-containing protein [Subsaxibacter sp. CAU 1640]|uniref:T9SS type A sorting domain-containing protein n=1 Tax=Subsaxibacter sp. CAU 1640 TaxID=2933271 RepID=UPI002004C737|nr:T9SS type A sorting domain-containing protein [Subsaxibacter sp. CAU 1640]MCK7591694.1 T9SS type A sorting domain-containing protein [Subsaxibacter sp. CAU 1640]